MRSEPETTVAEEKETGRLEAFSDGVFGIAMTLLVLDIKVPRPADLTGFGLGEALLRQWPAYCSYVLSFLTILIMWTNHHKLFRLIRKTDHAFLMINGILLMFVTLVPFPTALLAAHLGQPGQQTAAAVYAGEYVMIAFWFTVLWRYASQHERLLARDYDRAAAAGISAQYRFGPLMYLAALGLAFLNAAASVLVCAALAIFFALPGLVQKGKA